MTAASLQTRVYRSPNLCLSGRTPKLLKSLDTGGGCCLSPLTPLLRRGIGGSGEPRPLPGRGRAREKAPPQTASEKRTRSGSSTTGSGRLDQRRQNRPLCPDAGAGSWRLGSGDRGDGPARRPPARLAGPRPGRQQDYRVWPWGGAGWTAASTQGRIPSGARSILPDPPDRPRPLSTPSQGKEPEMPEPAIALCQVGAAFMRSAISFPLRPILAGYARHAAARPVAAPAASRRSAS